MTNSPKVKLSHRIEAFAARAILALFRALPPATASNLAGRVAGAIGPLIPVSNVADRNLRMAIPEMSNAERRVTIRQVWENLGRTVAELPHMGELHETESGPGFRISGWEHVEAALQGGGPSLFLTGHFGNWEILPLACYARGMDLAFLYRAAGNPLVDDMIQQMRNTNIGRKVTMFAKGGAGARGAYAHLTRKGHLAMLIDQKLNNGIAVPFFGQSAMTAPALASFALRFRCPIFPVHVVREGPARLHVIFEAPLILPDSGNKEADVLTVMTAANQILERWIRGVPGAWLWLHNRWPKPPKI